jgi:hypothetical protein
MKTAHLIFFACGFLALTACDDLYTPTPRPYYVIRVTPTAQGDVATPPTCASWNTDVVDPFDNQPTPQFGCATMRNLASMAENPDDLVEGRPLADARGVTSVGAVRRYDNNQPRGFIMPANEDSQPAVTTASTAASAMTGDVTGGAGSSSSSAGAAAAATP